MDEVCDAFLCPSLATAGQHADWCEASDLQVRCHEDLTSQVRATWEILTSRVDRWWLWPLRSLVGRDVRRFVDGFPLIAEAYESGAMTYGLLLADRPQGRPRIRSR